MPEPIKTRGKLDDEAPVCELCRVNPISDAADEHHLWCDECLDEVYAQ